MSYMAHIRISALPCMGQNINKKNNERFETTSLDHRVGRGWIKVNLATAEVGHGDAGFCCHPRHPPLNSECI